MIRFEKMTDRFQNTLHRLIKTHSFLHMLDTTEQKMAFCCITFHGIHNTLIIRNINSNGQQHNLLLPCDQFIFDKKFLFQCGIHILP